MDVTVTPHTFRRSCTTEMIRGGANLYHVKDLLGHETLDTLRHYVKLNVDDLGKNAGALSSARTQRPGGTRRPKGADVLAVFLSVVCSPLRCARDRIRAHPVFDVRSRSCEMGRGGLRRRRFPVRSCGGVTRSRVRRRSRVKAEVAVPAPLDMQYIGPDITIHIFAGSSTWTRLALQEVSTCTSSPTVILSVKWIRLVCAQTNRGKTNWAVGWQTRSKQRRVFTTTTCRGRWRGL